jgi:type I restriction enzyme S subunit
VIAQTEKIKDSEDWVKTNLGSVATVIVGGTPRTDVDAFWDGEISWMASGDVHLRRIFDVPGRITELGLRSSNTKIIEPPAIAIALAGQGRTRGTVALTYSPICTNQSIALVKTDENLDINYLFYDLENRYEELRTMSAGGGRAGLTKSIIESIPLFMPKPDEQRKIVEILDAADEAIAACAAALNKLLNIKAGLLNDLLARGLDASGNLRDAERQPELFKLSLLGSIPKDWKVEKLGKFSELQRGFDLPDKYRVEGDFPIYGSNGRNGSHNDFRVKAPGVITGRSGSIGFVYYIEEDFWALNTTLYVKEFFGNYPKFVKLTLESLKLERFAAATGVPSLNRNFIHPLLVKVPPIKEQRQIVEILEAHDTLIRAEETELEKLKQLKKGLMYDLLTGAKKCRI